jgi:hypothetical protein
MGFPKRGISRGVWHHSVSIVMMPCRHVANRDIHSPCISPLYAYSVGSISPGKARQLHPVSAFPGSSQGNSIKKKKSMPSQPPALQRKACVPRFHRSTLGQINQSPVPPAADAPHRTHLDVVVVVVPTRTQTPGCGKPWGRGRVWCGKLRGRAHLSLGEPPLRTDTTPSGHLVCPLTSTRTSRLAPVRDTRHESPYDAVYDTSVLLSRKWPGLRGARPGPALWGWWCAWLISLLSCVSVSRSTACLPCVGCLCSCFRTEWAQASGPADCLLWGRLLCLLSLLMLPLPAGSIAHARSTADQASGPRGYPGTPLARSLVLSQTVPITDTQATTHDADVFGPDAPAPARSSPDRRPQ